MKNNNPMYNSDTAKKVGKIKSIQMKGKTYEEMYTLLDAKRMKKLASTRMKKNNPMFNQNSVLKAQLTKKQRTYKPRIVTDKTKQTISEKNSHDWYITYPNGTEIKINNLLQFCKKNNLCNSLMVRVANGERQTHKKFKCKRC